MGKPRQVKKPKKKK